MLARLADQLNIPIVNEFCSNWLINLPSEEIKPENRFKLLYVACNFQLSIDCQAKFLMATIDTLLEQFIDLDPFTASCAGDLLISALAT
jgi:hypothetical protein